MGAVRCYECGGRIVKEDEVVFCEDCLFVFSRPTQVEIESPQKRGRKAIWKKKWPQWRKRLVSAVKATRWKPGEMVRYSPRKLRGTICISRTGSVYYRYN